MDFGGLVTFGFTGAFFAAGFFFTALGGAGAGSTGGVTVKDI